MLSLRNRMSENKKFWRSQIEIIGAKDLPSLQGNVNHFCKDKFVVGIQYPDTFQVDGFYFAVVSYKVLESENKE